ncbi:FmdE family protein [Holophaga foetida]|uniref:FmdE family protein n=1 Tax=Holophaga foetida TaxID=35839 RepID=UPI0002473EFF|nr:FmdE family protein [Holophaga foetida]
MDIHTVPFGQHLKEAEVFHGHLCGGIVSGVRMALRGLKEIGIRDPKGEDRKNLIVFVEIDRCATDAITSVTGCRPGKRSMKIKDYGKMAATFINLESGRAVRLASKGPKDSEQAGSLEDAIKAASDEDLFWIQHGSVPLGAGDLPGRPVRSVPCAHCGESVMDMRDLCVNGESLCQPCAEGQSYFIPGRQA